MLFNARNGPFDSCTLTSGSELWLFLLSVDVTHSCVQSVSGDLGGCVCARLRELKPESNSKALQGKSVDVRAGITTSSTASASEVVLLDSGGYKASPEFGNLC